jgi:peptide deformylase
MKIDTVMTHVSHEEDLPFLRTKLYDVNMRLFRINSNYRDVIDRCCEAMNQAFRDGFEDYKPLHGISGANLAIPFNIIGIVRNRGRMNAYLEIMINPKITKTYGDIVESESNCGSIRLKEPISIKRHEMIDLEWFDASGTLIKKEGIGRQRGSLTIQHEVDHNLGILITD